MANPNSLIESEPIQIPYGAGELLHEVPAVEIGSVACIRGADSTKVDETPPALDFTGNLGEYQPPEVDIQNLN